MNIKEYINKWKNKNFKFGEADCYVFVREWIDLNFPENKLPKHEYKDLKGALAWNKKYDWVEEIKKYFEFEIINFPSVQDGDLLIVRDDFQCAHLVADNKVWSMDKEINLIGVNLFLYTAQTLFIRLRRAY